MGPSYMPVPALNYPPYQRCKYCCPDFFVCFQHIAKGNTGLRAHEGAPNSFYQVFFPIYGSQKQHRASREKREMSNPQSKALFLPDITFIVRLGIIFPFISEGSVHINPLLVFRSGICLIFNNQVHILAIIDKYCSIHHGEDINESFI